LQQVFVYFLNMKFWVLILVLAISVQPLQAGFCDMNLEESPETSHQMDHSGQDPSGTGGHDCCGSDDSDSPAGCDGDMNCGPCFVSVSAIPSFTRFTTVVVRPDAPTLPSGVVLPSHTAPPFRPPIS
jgi:hypothetical protein